MQNCERILVVDDETTIHTVIAEALQNAGYQVQTASDARQALHACRQTPFELVLLDLRMPGEMDGLDLLKEIHQRLPRTTVIVLTGYGTLDSAVAAMRAGAFDYLIKPASIAQIVSSVENGLAKRREEVRRHQLITRLEETLRELKKENAEAQTSSDRENRFVQTPAITLDRHKRIAIRGNETLGLTATEFDLLEYLMRHADRLVTAVELVKAIQGYDLIEPDARPLIRVHVQRLRQKLEDDPENPQYILNVRGKGYRFVG